MTKPSWQLVVMLGGIILFWPHCLLAHGTAGIVSQGGWTVAAQYVGGEVMSFAKVTITAPNGTKPFQTGRTDQNGRFAFVPDVPGTWRFVADDEMGHRLSLTIEVTPDGLTGKQPPPAAPTAPASLASRALFGVGLLLLVASLAFWCQARKMSGKKVDS